MRTTSVRSAAALAALVGAAVVGVPAPAAAQTTILPGSFSPIISLDGSRIHFLDAPAEFGAGRPGTTPGPEAIGGVDDARRCRGVAHHRRHHRVQPGHLLGAVPPYIQPTVRIELKHVEVQAPYAQHHAAGHFNDNTGQTHPPGGEGWNSCGRVRLK